MNDSKRAGPCVDGDIKAGIDDVLVSTTPMKLNVTHGRRLKDNFDFLLVDSESGVETLRASSSIGREGSWFTVENPSVKVAAKGDNPSLGGTREATLFKGGADVGTIKVKRAMMSGKPTAVYSVQGKEVYTMQTLTWMSSEMSVRDSNGNTVGMVTKTAVEVGAGVDVLAVAMLTNIFLHVSGPSAWDMLMAPLRGEVAF